MMHAGRHAGIALPMLLIVLGAMALTVIAEDVVRRDEHQWVLQLDYRARDQARLLAAQPTTRRVAAAVSRLTGEGLVLAVLAGTAGLFWARRRRDALILLGGTLSAWALTGLLKLAFGVPRPHPGRPTHAITGYGFPSGHTVVVVVAGGLIAWLASRHASARIRVLLAAVVAFVAVLTGAARLVLNAHWLSDITAGLAAGALWLGVIMLTAPARHSPGR